MMAHDVDKDYTSDIMQTLYQFSRDKVQTDFKIRAGNKTAHCHSAVLSAKSTYFKAICASGMQEAILGHSISKEEHGDILDTVVRFLYLGKSNITVHNVEKVVQAADFLNHEEMKNECERIMLLNLDVSKLTSYHKLAQRASLSTLNTSCLQFAKDNFTEVAHSPWFLGLISDEAHMYLQDDDLNVTTEDDVFFAVLRWLKKSNETSTVIEQDSKRLFQCVRVKFCQRATLESLSNDETIIDSLRLKILEFLHHGRHGEGERRKSYSAAHSVSPSSKELPSASVPGTATREKLPSTKSTLKKPITASAKPASPSAKLLVASPLKTKEEVLIVGGRKTGNSRHENIAFLDKDPKDCILTQVPLCAEAWDSSVCAHKDTLIVSGGYHSAKRCSISKVQKFSLRDRQWLELRDLPFPVDLHGCSCTAAKLYTFGGRYTENSSVKHRCAPVNVLDFSSLTWEECQPLPIAVSEPGIATLAENIYAIGGDNGTGWSCQTVKLNTRTGKITKCESMPKAGRVYLCTVVVHQHIFVLATSMFMQYDTKKDQWTELPLPMKPSMRPAMVLKENHLLVLGGYEKDPENPNDVIQEYDLSSKQWTLEAHKMPLPLSCHSAFVMEISQPK